MADSYGYIAETSHGDVSFTTPTHHEAHHDTFYDWYEKYKDGINTLISALGVGVQLLGIHTARQGQRLQQISKKPD